MANTRARRAELARLIPEYYLSDKRITTAAAAAYFKMSDSTIRRYLLMANVPIRNTWSRKLSIVDGKKFCPICKQTKVAATEFYSRASGRPYTYCKICDKARSVAACRRNRRVVSDRKKRVREMVRKNNIEARMLLKDAVAFIREISDYAPIVDRIETFFISEKNMLNLLELS